MNFSTQKEDVTPVNWKWEEIEKNEDSVTNFIKNCCKPSSGETITKKELYDCYCGFCKKENVIPLTKKAFGIKISNSTNYILSPKTPQRKKVGGKWESFRVWKGIKINEVF